MLPADWNNQQKSSRTTDSMNSNDAHSYYNKENINMLLPTSLGDNSTDNTTTLDNNNNNNTSNPNVMAFMGLINQIGMESDKTKEKPLMNVQPNMTEAGMNPAGTVPSMAPNDNQNANSTNTNGDMNNANDLNNYALNVYFNSYANFFAANPNMIPGGMEMIKDTLPQPPNGSANNTNNNTEGNAMYFSQQPTSQQLGNEDFYNNNNNNNNICPSMVNNNQNKSIPNSNNNMDNGNNKDKLENSMNSSSTSSGFASSFSSNDTSTPHRKEQDEIQPQKRLKIDSNNERQTTSSASPASSACSFVTTAAPVNAAPSDKVQQPSADIPADGEGINGVAALAAAAFSSTSTAALLRGKNFIAHNSAHHPSGQKKRPRPVPEENKDMTYFEKRKRNNESAKRSRDQRRVKEEQIALRAVYLEQENFQLKAELHKLRTYILQQQQQQALNSCETVQFAPLQF